MSNARQEAIKAIALTKHKLDNVDFKTIHLKNIFGSNVFSEAEMQSRLPKTAFKSLMKTIHEGRSVRPRHCRRRRRRHARLGARTRRNALHASVPADDRHHRREARQLPYARRLGRAG